MLEIRLSTNKTYQGKSPVFHITDSAWKDYIAYVNICGYWQRSLESDGGFDVAKPERDYYSTGEMLSDFQIDRLVTGLFGEKLKDLNKKLLESNKCVDIAIFKYGASYSGGKEYFLATDDGGKNFTRLARLSSGHWHLVDANEDNLKQFVLVLHGNLEECYQDIVKKEEEKMSDLEFTEEKHTNENGAIQTKLPTRMDLIPADVLLKVSSVLADGADKYGEWNWKGITVEDNLNHALTHVYRYLDGDTSEPHLVHAICRLMFASHIHNTTKDND